MPLSRMCKIKEVPEKTGGLLTEYMTRKLYLEGRIPGARLGNSIILIDLDGLENWLDQQSRANIKQQEATLGYGNIRKIQ